MKTNNDMYRRLSSGCHTLPLATWYLESIPLWWVVIISYHDVVWHVVDGVVVIVILWR